MLRATCRRVRGTPEPVGWAMAEPFADLVNESQKAASGSLYGVIFDELYPIGAQGARPGRICAVTLGCASLSMEPDIPILHFGAARFTSGNVFVRATFKHGPAPIRTCPIHESYHGRQDDVVGRGSVVTAGQPGRGHRNGLCNSCRGPLALTS